MHAYLFCLPLISAITGWLIHFCFSRYLLHKWLPAKQPAIAAAIGEKAAAIVKNEIDIEKHTGNPQLLDKVLPAIEQHIDEFLNVKLKEEIPMLAMFVGNKTTDKIREVFINQIKILFPQMMAKVGNELLTKIDVERIVSDKLGRVDLSDSIVLRKYTNRFSLLGLLCGLIIGLINLVVVYFVLYN